MTGRSAMLWVLPVPMKAHLRTGKRHYRNRGIPQACGGDSTQERHNEELNAYSGEKKWMTGNSGPLIRS
jgi:hypothetical protein